MNFFRVISCLSWLKNTTAKFLQLADFIHKKHKITVIFVTHMIFKIPVSSARVMVLKKGGIYYDGKAALFFRKKNVMEEIYG